MLCYKDMTFCSYWKDCAKSKECGRAFTPEEEERADEWWGEEGAPICFFVSKPECWEVNDE